MEKMKHEDFNVLLSEYNRQHDIPGTGLFELTPLCNLNCKMCYVHLQDPSLKDRLLPGSTWIALMKDAIAHGMTRAILSGGEAMTHPDFMEIYRFLIDEGVEVQVKTNGILLDGPRLELFKKYPPIMVDVSLYGCNSESYLAVTGVDACERVVSNIRNALSEGLHVRLAVTPSAQMMPWIEDVMRLADSFHISVTISDFLIPPNDDTGRSRADFGLTISDFERIDRLRDEIFDPKDVKKDEYEPDESVERPLVGRGLRCAGGRSSFTINWDGTLSPCVSFPREIVLAEPMKTGFGPAWKIINEAVKQYEHPQKSRDCAVSRWCVYCPVKHPKASPLHRCDDAACEFLIAKFRRNMKKEGQTL